MRIEVTYYADDGVEFDTEEECRAYEEEQNACFDSVMFFNEKFEWKKEPDASFIESDAVYFKVLNADKAERLFRWLYEWCGACFPENPLEDGHVYAYDDEDYHADNYWVDVTERFEKMRDIIQKAEGAE